MIEPQDGRFARAENSARTQTNQRAGDVGLLMAGESKTDLGDPGTKPLVYTIVAQDAAEVQDVGNAPAVSMAAFLELQGRLHTLPTLSIYAERGGSRAEVRLLYMNEAALRVWREMGRVPKEIGKRHRPPMTSTLAFGQPFSE